MTLQDEATRCLDVLSYATRAFVVEFAGSPKSGKSTSVEAIRHFLTRSGFRVHVLTERAALCPIPMKGHLFFNTWCAMSMLAELLANVDTPTDVIIVDRGLFDSLVWMRQQWRRGELTDDEARAFEDFVLMDRWRALIDLNIVMKVDGVEAIARENTAHIIEKPGSVMNQTSLSALSDAVDDAADKYSQFFPDLVKVDSTGQKIKKFNSDLATTIFQSFYEFLNPEILVIPKAVCDANDLLPFCHSDHSQIFKLIKKHGLFVRRDEAEVTDQYIQIIPCGVLKNRKNIFLFQRKDKDPKNDMYGKFTTWIGSHVRPSTNDVGCEVILRALRTKMRSHLHMNQFFYTHFVGHCYTADTSESRKHLGLIFLIDVDNEATVFDLTSKEFRRGREHNLAGTFVRVSDLQDSDLQNQMEPWSRALLDEAQGLLAE